ncbi:MAG: hypothetical protein MUD01_10585 [Chloroflexaceae bacterium]|jgi:hypothetical protein|nr:hypothetical protein [Chloroflexaceae bacterium]
MNAQPFATYVRRVLRHLYDLTPAQRRAIEAELYAHLEDWAAEQGRSPGDADLQAEVIEELGTHQEVGRSFALAYCTPRRRGFWFWFNRLLRAEVAACIALVGLLSGWMAQEMAPPVSAANVAEISGTLARLDTACCDDVLLELREYRAAFVINSDLVKLLDLERLRGELQPGQLVSLTVYRRWLPGEPDQAGSTPVVELRTANAIYLDRNAVAPARQYSQPMLQTVAVSACMLCLVVALLHLSRRLGRWRPTWA